MNNYVRVVGGVVVETVQSDIAISELFHPAAGFITAGDDVSVGWLFVDGKFYAPKVDDAYTFKQAKTAKLAEINSRAQDYINLATGAADTPSFEVQTWAQQAAEAKAWHADSSAETPMLTIIANQRGIPVDILRAKAYEKSVAYEQLVAIVAGRRQRYEQMLDAAKTLDDIEKIVVAYAV